MKIYFFQCKQPVDKEILDKHKSIQVLNSRSIAGQEHIEFALSQAKKAFERSENISDDLLVEVMVRASASRQVKKAFELFGLPAKEIVVFGEQPPKILHDYGCQQVGGEVTLEKYEHIKKVFSVHEEEIRSVSAPDHKSRVITLQNIIKERIALINAL